MKSTYRYLPVNAEQRKWGLYATCAGHTRTEPGAVFPSPEHPDQYFFSWRIGRVLHEWQFIMVEDGGGTVEFEKRSFRARAGSLIALRPGAWHRYRPDPKTGWTTLWMGFGGDLADRLVGIAMFDDGGEVRKVGAGGRFHRMLQTAVEDALDSGPGGIYTMGAQIPALAAALAEDAPTDAEGAADADIVHRAQTFIGEHASETVDFAALAESLGVTYRSLRYLFAKETDTAPLRYQLEVRLARAKNLLRSSDMPIAEIARTLGFRSLWHFSHFFKKHTSTSAAEYRAAHAQMRGQGQRGRTSWERA